MKRRRLSPEANSKKGGAFSFDLGPWQREVLDEYVNPEVGRIVLMWASQVTGKTETINNMTGFDIECDPCPSMMVQPTVEMAEVWSKDRFTPMARDTPCLRRLVTENKSRTTGNTILSKRFPGGHLAIIGANAPAGLAMRPIRKVKFDEVDRYPASAGTEGDPIALAEKRTETFSDAMIVETSTPTIRGISRIEKSFEQSDQRYWFVEFPCCGHEANLVWKMVQWEEGDASTAHIECPNCKAKLTDADRRLMVLNGKWKATAPFKNGIRGYHLNGIYCLFAPKRQFKNRLHQMVAAFLKAKSEGKESLKVWVNTFLAETWREDADRISAHELGKRAEDYTPETLPLGALVVTAAVDVQGNRFEVEFEAWGEGRESWGVQFEQIPCDPLRPESWKLLDALWERKFKRADGVEMSVAAAAIDTGFATDMVHVYCKPKFARRIFAVKGANQSGLPIVSTLSHTGKRRCPYFRLGTDTAKGMIHGWLKIAEVGPGYKHFPKGFGYDDNYFAGLTVEELRKEYHKGRERLVWWKPQGARNEPLDLRVYNLAALTILNPNWKALAANYLRKPLESAKKDFTLATEAPAEVQAPKQTNEPKPETKPAPRRKPFVMRMNTGWRRL